MTAKEIIDRIGVGEKNKIILYKASAKYVLWWEDSERWFCNMKSIKDTTSVWLIAKDLESHIDFMFVRKGYKVKET